MHAAGGGSIRSIWEGVDRGWARPPDVSSWFIRLMNLAAASVNLVGVDRGWTRPPVHGFTWEGVDRG